MRTRRSRHLNSWDLCTMVSVSVSVIALILVNSCNANWFEDEKPKKTWNYLTEDEDLIHSFGTNLTGENFLKILQFADNFVIVGGRNAVYNLSWPHLVEDSSKRITWKPRDVDRELCLVKGKNENDCQNFIRVFSELNSGFFLICGTNAFNPRCRHYRQSPSSPELLVESEFSAKGFAPYDPRHNSTAIVAGGELYSGTVADFSGSDALIIRGMTRTEQYDLKHLNAPDFVGSIEHDNFVYFFFRETAVEYINCGKTRYSRVARVCKNDNAGDHWTSFLKTRLNCSVPGDIPFYFDEIQSIFQRDDSVFAVFTTPENAIAGSAICEFNINDIASIFASSPFKSQSTVNSNWLPIPKSATPEPRPGQCYSDTFSSSEASLNFIRRHTLLDEAAMPKSGKPGFVRTHLSQRLVSIHVTDELIVVGTNQGKLLKLRRLGTEQQQVVLEESLQVFDSSARISEVFINNNHVLAGHSEQIITVPLHRCDTFIKCELCVQDYGCIWDLDKMRCVARHPTSDFFYALTELECPRPATTTTTTTTTTHTTTTTTIKTTSTYKEETSSSSDALLLEIPLGVVNERALRNESRRQSCPICSCTCPPSSPVTSTLSTETLPKRGTSSTTKIVSEITSSAPTILAVGSTTTSTTYTDQEPDNSVNVNNNLPRKRKELDLFLDLLDVNNGQNWHENDIFLAEKVLPKRESKSPSLDGSKTYSEEALAGAAIVSAIISLIMGFIIGVLASRLFAKCRASSSLDKKAHSPSHIHSDHMVHTDPEDPDGGFLSSSSKASTRAIAGKTTVAFPPPKTLIPNQLDILEINNNTMNNKPVIGPDRQSTSTLKKPSQTFARCLPQRVKKIYL